MTILCYTLLQDPANTGDKVILVCSLIPGGVAERDNRLQVGDRLLSVNDVSVVDHSLQFAVQQLTSIQVRLLATLYTFCAVNLIRFQVCLSVELQIVAKIRVHFKIRSVSTTDTSLTLNRRSPTCSLLSRSATPPGIREHTPPGIREH